MFNKKIGIVILTFLLPACSLISPAKTEQMTEYVINASPEPRIQNTSYKKTILVPPVIVNSVFDTSEMAYTTHFLQVNYFAKNRWATTPSRMLKPLVVTALQKTHYFNVVDSLSGMVNYDYILTTEVVQFLQDFTVVPNLARIELRAQLISKKTHKVMASKEFPVAQIMPYCSPYGGVVAMNKAVSILLSDLARWTVKVSRE